MHLDDKDSDTILSVDRDEFKIDEPSESLEYEELLKQEWQEYKNSPEGKCRLAAEAATNAAKNTLGVHGWFKDPNGDWDFTMFEVERMLMEYLERYMPEV